MAYAERRERQKGVRYRGMYKAADGRYRSAGTFSTEERALEVAKEAEKHAVEVIRGAAGGLDPGVRATRTIKEYVPVLVENSAAGADLGFHAACRYSLISPPSLARRWIRVAGPGRAITSWSSSGARRLMPLPWWLRPVL